MTTEVQEEKQESFEKIFLANGVQYGRSPRFTHPSMRPFLKRVFVGKIRSSLEIFDVRRTYEYLKQAASYLKNLLQENKIILFVGITPGASKPVEDLANLLGQPYLNYKWVGGFLTNFETIKARLLYFKKLLEKEKSGIFDQYPPKERKRFVDELEKMKKIYSGVKDLEKRPDCVFIVNLAYKQHRTAKREAVKLKIPIVALAGSDNDITNVDFVIPGNDKAPRSIATVLSYLGRMIKGEINT